NALAQSRDDNWKLCANDSDDPDLKIGGCTAIIQSGQETNENLAAAFYDRGGAYDDKDQVDRAIQDYSQAIQLRPDYAHALRNRGRDYGRTGDYGRAIADFDHAIQADPSYVDAYENRGYAYYFEGQYDRAIRDENQALRLSPNDAIAYYVRPGEAEGGRRRRRRRRHRPGQAAQSESGAVSDPADSIGVVIVPQK